MLKLKSYCNRGKTWTLILMMCFIMILSGPAMTSAANSDWDTAIAGIGQLHDAFSALELENKTEKLRIQELSRQNNAKLKSIQTSVQQIDKTKLDQLKSQAELAQKKYAPLLTEYAELGKKAAEARKRKDGKSALLYDLKRNRIKASVTNARSEIKSRQDAYASAKKQATAKAKVVKDILAGIQPLKKQVTAENSHITGRNQAKTAAEKRYKAAVKEGNAVSAAAELKIMVEELQRIRDSQTKIMQWEKAMKEILRRAEVKLPS
ncbi:hypothetical protein [Paenibacillus chibensis]|uniref:hypothetical protein n=3 Tax=Paenibacillus chibensis TaxID=59846 RepID=UPI000FDBEA0A